MLDLYWGRTGFLLVYVCLSSGSHALAQSSVSLSSGTGAPGTEVSVPLYLNFERERDVAQIIARFEYPVGQLEFARGEPSFLAKRESVSVEFKVIEAEEGAGSREGKEIEITMRASAGETLPNGLVSSLFFKIPKSAPYEAIPISFVNIVTLDAEDKPVREIVANNGSVVVFDPDVEPIAACFFYMH